MTNKNNELDKDTNAPKHGEIVNMFVANDLDIHKNVDFLKLIVFNAMCSILNEQLGVEYSKIKIEDNIMGDLGADELDIAGIVEESFDIEIPVDLDYKLNTVKDFVDFITDAKLASISK